MLIIQGDHCTGGPWAGGHNKKPQQDVKICRTSRCHRCREPWGGVRSACWLQEGQQNRQSSEQVLPGVRRHWTTRMPNGRVPSPQHKTPCDHILLCITNRDRWVRGWLFLRSRQFGWWNFLTSHLKMCKLWEKCIYPDFTEKQLSEVTQQWLSSLRCWYCCARLPSVGILFPHLWDWVAVRVFSPHYVLEWCFQV